MKIKFHQFGFTIVELMIATSVFSVVLLVALAGFSEVGNIFYKGVAINQTQNVTSQIMNDLRANIQAASSVSTVQNSNPSDPGNGYNYYCIGNVRYTFQVNPPKPLDASNEDYTSPKGNYGLLKDVLPGNGSCAAPCVSGCGLGQVAFSNQTQEILGDKMQLIRFDIMPDSGQLYNVYVNVAYGDNSDFVNLGDPDQMTCQGGLSDQKFCAVIRLSSGIYQGLHS